MNELAKNIKVAYLSQFSKTMNRKTIVLIIILVIILGLGVGGYFGVKKAIQLGKERGEELLNELSEKSGKVAEKSGQPVKESGQPAEKSGKPYDKPTADVPGRDLPDVPRYPGSVRSMCGTIPGLSEEYGFYIMYDAPGSAEEVKDFYEVQLPANGWESSVSEEEAEKRREDLRQMYEEWKEAYGIESYKEMFGTEEVMKFYRFIDQTLTKGERTIVVQVGIGGSDYPGYTDVTITLPSDPSNPQGF